MANQLPAEIFEALLRLESARQSEESHTKQCNALRRVGLILSDPSDKVKLYVQNVPTSLTFGGSNIPTTTSNPADDARIAGMLFTGQPRYFNGGVSLTQIYNRALSQAEITQNFNATRGRFGI